jgi:O-antigen/teichoic acid export membrane protein
VALWLSSTLFVDVPPNRDGSSLARDAWSLLSFAAPISAYQFLNAFILRIDMIMLGWFVGRAPGVTLTTVGVYGVALGIANGLRKINHAFNPIFAPVIAGLTATGDRTRAIATYARLAQWMLWLLLPTLAVIMLAGDTILLIYGPVFRQGSTWLGITAVACAIEAYVGFGETIIMVQRPHLNLLNSSITCVIAVLANLWLIPRFGVTGAAFGILVPFLAQGILRYIALRFIFRWHNPLSNIAPPVIAAALAIFPALLCRTRLHGIPGEIASAAVFLVVFGLGWKYHRTRSIDG